MLNATVTELSEQLTKGAISARELTQHYLRRIEQLDGKLNSFITTCPELALQQAAQADEQRARGNFTALTGIPIALKDLICTQGIKTSCGSKMLDNFVAPYSATLAKKLAAAGTVLLGKNNLDEFAMGSSNETSYYGPCHNPWQHEHSPGGSSGGSAAAVAARLCAAAIGTDTGGSIRQPAAFCGVTGIKPSYGRISRYGMVAYASSFDQAGPLTQTAADAALFLNVLCSHDPQDSTSLQVASSDFGAQLSQPLNGLRIGLPEEYFSASLDQALAAQIETAIEVLQSLGARCQTVSLPSTAAAIPAYYVLASAECSANLARFDGVRFGHRCQEAKDLQDLYQRSRSEGFGEEVKRRIMTGTYALSAGYYEAYYHKAQRIRRLISDDFNNVFAEVDVILSPTTPTPAFKLNEKTSDPISMYLADVYTIAVNLAGLPAMSVPVGFVTGLPVAMQLIGRYLDEATVLQVAHQYQLATHWQQTIPKGFAADDYATDLA